MEGSVNFELHEKFARALMAMPNEMWIFAGRGSGKTTQVTAPWLKHMAEAMPRSTGGIIGQSFTDLETKILQPIFIGWQMHGLEIDNHYVYGKRPYSDWDKPLTPVLDHSHVISFPNGSNIELISLHMKGSANSKSLQYIAGPEAKFFNAHQIREEVIPILRGHVKYFGDSPWYGAKLFETDKFSPNMSWLLDKRKLHDEDLIRTIIYYQLKMNDLILKRAGVSKSHGYTITRDIEKLQKVLNKLRKNTVYVGEANAYDNIRNLSSDYIHNMERTLTDYEFKIAIKNEDPTRSENGFYPDRNEEHLYISDDDEDDTKPVGVAFDYQASITPLVSFQVNDRVIPDVKTLNFLSSIYVKHPFGPRDVINTFCTRNRNRPCKIVYYFFDHTAVGERAGHKKIHEEITEYFEEEGWTVVEVYMFKAPLHSDKYNRFKYFLINKDGTTLPIRMHANRCAPLILSMDMTGTVETDKGTKKDKSKEKDRSFPQEQAPHQSDVFDMIAWGVLELDMYPAEEVISGGNVFLK